MKKANWFILFGVFLMSFGFYVLIRGMVDGSLKAGLPQGFDEWMFEFYISMKILSGMIMFSIGKHFVRT